MKFPLAYLITWTTYGTWLHGDDRGSFDHNGDFILRIRPAEMPRPPRGRGSGAS